MQHPHHYYSPVHYAADVDLKRRYLTLLPPQQIIEICLAFDYHVPPYVKTTIWPLDLNSAISTIQSHAKAQEKSKKDEPPVMDSLVDPDEGVNTTKTPQPTDPPAPVSEPKPPDKTPTPSPAVAPTPTPAPAPTPSYTAPTPSAPPSAPPPQPFPPPQPGYPHQPYGFPGQPAYPHAPYYAQHWPSYGSMPYPSAAYSSAAQKYPAQPPPQQTPTIPPPPLAVSAALKSADEKPHPDELPSYEEMIVEALTESISTDSTGQLAPKDLFNWMAARYPVQSNFRPSASQALQKAFRKGRFEKNNAGKYSLNPKYEGGTAARRTSRRPPASANAPSTTSSSQPPGPPFTHAPLQRTGQFPYGYHGYNGGFSGFVHYPPSAGVKQAAAKTTMTTEKPPEKELDAYEAAQHILKSINFGELLQMDGNKEEEEEEEKEQGVRAELQGQLALLAAQLAAYAKEDAQETTMSNDTLQYPSNSIADESGGTTVPSTDTPTTPTIPSTTENNTTAAAATPPSIGDTDMASILPLPEAQPSEPPDGSTAVLNSSHGGRADAAAPPIADEPGHSDPLPVDGSVSQQPVPSTENESGGDATRQESSEKGDVNGDTMPGILPPPTVSKDNTDQISQDFAAAFADMSEEGDEFNTEDEDEEDMDEVII